MQEIYYAAAGGVVIYDGQVLLIRKKYIPEVRLPKGHIEPGESRVEAALREVGEETGYRRLHILADLGSVRNEFTHDDRHVIRDESYFLMGLDDPAPVEREPAEAAKFSVEWVSLDRAEAVLTFPVEQEFVRRARNLWALKGTQGH